MRHRVLFIDCLPNVASLLAHIVENLPAVQDTGFGPWIGKIWRGNGNSLEYSCLENSMDTGAWQAIPHGVAKSQIRLRD